MEFTFISTGMRCELCSFVWLGSYKPRDGKPAEKVRCPNCKQWVEYEVVSLDDLKNESGKTSHKY